MIIIALLRHRRQVTKRMKDVLRSSFSSGLCPALFETHEYKTANRSKKLHLV
jgi:hypothetical protein